MKNRDLKKLEKTISARAQSFDELREIEFTDEAIVIEYAKSIWQAIFPVPPEKCSQLDFYHTALGRVLSRSPHPDSDVISHPDCAELLMVSRGSIEKKVTRGNLEVNAKGEILLASALSQFDKPRTKIYKQLNQ